MTVESEPAAVPRRRPASEAYGAKTGRDLYRLLALADSRTRHASRGTVEMSIAKICDRLGCSQRSAERAREWLADNGYAAVVRGREYGTERSPAHVPDRYTLLTDPHAD